MLFLPGAPRSNKQITLYLSVIYAKLHKDTVNVIQSGTERDHKKELGRVEQEPHLVKGCAAKRTTECLAAPRSGLSIIGDDLGKRDFLINKPHRSSLSLSLSFFAEARQKRRLALGEIYRGVAL